MLYVPSCEPRTTGLYVIEMERAKIPKDRARGDLSIPMFKSISCFSIIFLKKKLSQCVLFC